MENLFSGALVLGLVLSCCGASGFALEKDCGIDGFDCFADSAEDGCSPAKTLIADDMPLEARITGKYDSDSCNIELRGLAKSELYDLFRSEGADESAIQMFDATYGSHYSAIENKKATCIVYSSYTEEFLQYEEIGQYCSGELVSAMD